MDEQDREAADALRRYIEEATADTGGQRGGARLAAAVAEQARARLGAPRRPGPGRDRADQQRLGGLHWQQEQYERRYAVAGRP
jgi:hypothetical protein